MISFNSKQDPRNRGVTIPNGRFSIKFQKEKNNVEYIIEAVNKKSSHSGKLNPKKCVESDCLGFPVFGSRCIVHLENRELKDYLRQNNAQNMEINFSGSKVEGSFIEHVQKLIKTDHGLILPSVSLSCNHVIGDVHLDDLTFAGSVNLQASVFDGGAFLRNCHFKKFTNARYVFSIGQGPQFLNCSFAETLVIDFAHTNNGWLIQDCSFLGDLSLECAFASYGIYRCTIEGRLKLNNSCPKNLIVEESAVSSGIESDSIHSSEIVFSKVRAPRASLLGPFKVDGPLFFTDSVFGSKLQLTARAEGADFSGTLLENGGRILLDGASVILDSFSSEKRVHFLGLPFADVEPALVSVRNCDLANVHISGFDIQSCSFVGAHSIENCKFDASTHFALSPKFSLFAKRRVIYDEYLWRGKGKTFFSRFWRTEKSDRKALSARGLRSFLTLDNEDRLSAWEVGRCYRSLRRAFESELNFSMASDLYYGEMEMRRRSAFTPCGEKILIWLYWAVSGYGTRPARAMSLFLALLLASAAVASRFAVEEKVMGSSESLLFALKAALPGLLPGQELTFSGEWLVLVLAF